MKKEYIVGVDFGYDVTSAWIISLFDDNLYGESLKLKASNKESERSYYSIIYYNPKYGYSLDDLSWNIIAGFKDKVSVLDQPQNAKKREAYTDISNKYMHVCSSITQFLKLIKMEMPISICVLLFPLNGIKKIKTPI